MRHPRQMARHVGCRGDATCPSARRRSNGLRRRARRRGDAALGITRQVGCGTERIRRRDCRYGRYGRYSRYSRRRDCRATDCRSVATAGPGMATRCRTAPSTHAAAVRKTALPRAAAVGHVAVSVDHSRRTGKGRRRRVALAAARVVVRRRWGGSCGKGIARHRSFGLSLRRRPTREELQRWDEVPRRVLWRLAHRPEQLLDVTTKQKDAVVQLRAVGCFEVQRIRHRCAGSGGGTAGEGSGRRCARRWEGRGGGGARRRGGVGGGCRDAHILNCRA